MSASLSRSDRAIAGECNSRRKMQRMDLGLAVSSLTLKPGESRTIYQLAAYCACSPQAISQITTRALEKIRRALRRRYGITASHH